MALKHTPEAAQNEIWRIESEHLVYDYCYIEMMKRMKKQQGQIGEEFEFSIIKTQCQQMV